MKWDFDYLMHRVWIEISLTRYPSMLYYQDNWSIDWQWFYKYNGRFAKIAWLYVECITRIICESWSHWWGSWHQAKYESLQIGLQQGQQRVRSFRIGRRSWLTSFKHGANNFCLVSWRDVLFVIPRRNLIVSSDSRLQSLLLVQTCDWRMKWNEKKYLTYLVEAFSLTQWWVCLEVAGANPRSQVITR